MWRKDTCSELVLKKKRSEKYPDYEILTTQENSSYYES